MSLPRWPDVYGGLLALLPTVLPTVTVYDGQPAGSEDNPVDFWVVGHVSDDSAGSFTQAPDPSGFGTQEQGDIKCHVVSNDGGTDPSVTRARAFGFVGVVQAALVADRTFGGLLGTDSTLDLSVDVLAVQGQQGSATSLLVTLHYWTNTYHQ